MKKSILMSLITLFLLSTSGYAQNQIGRVKTDEGRKEKIFEKKLSFLKKNLNLTEEESVAFEKAFKQYVREKLLLKKSYKKEIYDKVKKEKLSELSKEEKELIIKHKLDLDKQQYELNSGFTKKLTKILPPEKVIRYFALERRFNRKMMNHVKKRQETMRKRQGMIHKRNEKH